MGGIGTLIAGGTTETTLSDYGIVAAEAPQTDAEGAMPFGTWKAIFSADGPVEASVRVQTTADGVFHGGMIDMHVYRRGSWPTER